MIDFLSLRCLLALLRGPRWIGGADACAIFDFHIGDEETQHRG